MYAPTTMNVPCAKLTTPVDRKRMTNPMPTRAYRLPSVSVFPIMRATRSGFKIRCIESERSFVDAGARFQSGSHDDRRRVRGIPLIGGHGRDRLVARRAELEGAIDQTS